MISQRDLLGLAGLVDFFPLIGDYLRGATSEVQFETDRGDQFRTHIIVDASSLPTVMLVVEGHSGAYPLGDLPGLRASGCIAGRSDDREIRSGFSGRGSGVVVEVFAVRRRSPRRGFGCPAVRAGVRSAERVSIELSRSASRGEAYK